MFVYSRNSLYICIVKQYYNTNIQKNSEPKPLSEGFSEENDRKNQAPMPNEGDMSECPTLSPFYRIRRAIQAQASASASA